jgi:hypothetical protein
MRPINLVRNDCPVVTNKLQWYKHKGQRERKKKPQSAPIDPKECEKQKHRYIQCASKSRNDSMYTPCHAKQSTSQPATPYTPIKMPRKTNAEIQRENPIKMPCG